MSLIDNPSLDRHDDDSYGFALNPAPICCNCGRRVCLTEWDSACLTLQDTTIPRNSPACRHCGCRAIVLAGSPRGHKEITRQLKIRAGMRSRDTEPYPDVPRKRWWQIWK
jgi:hypothetical protein